MATDFGRRVAAARKHAGLTQKQLAPRVGMSQSNLSELETVAYESGKTVQIARLCGVDPYWLATGDGDMLAGQLPTPVSSAAAPTLADALSVVLGRLPGLDEYTAGKVVAAVQAATRPMAPLEAIERDLAQWLGDRRADAGPAAAPEKRASSA